MPAVTDDHATLATRRPASALPGPDFHRLDRASLAWRTHIPAHPSADSPRSERPVRVGPFLTQSGPSRTSFDHLETTSCLRHCLIASPSVAREHRPQGGTGAPSAPEVEFVASVIALICMTAVCISGVYSAALLQAAGADPSGYGRSDDEGLYPCHERKLLS